MPEAESFVRPALYEYTADVCEPVKLRLGSSPYASQPPITIPALFNRTVNKFPDNPALSFKNESSQWQTLNYRQYQAKVHHIAKAFIKLGLQPRNTVAVISFNCPEWFYSELAAIHAGGIITGIYTTNSPEAIFHILNTSLSRILIVDDSKQMQKIRQIWSRLSNLKTVVQINGPFETDIGIEDGYYKWSDLDEMDTNELNEELTLRINNIAVNECCSLIYTSGTVGFPKGAMLSHDNITWDLKVIEERFGNIVPGQESTVSYLPLSHIAAQMMDMFLSISYGGCVYFADRDALKGSLVKTLNKVHPTRFIGVPRVYEKFYERLINVESQLPIVKKALLNWARSTALSHYMNLMEGKRSDSLQYKIAKFLVLNKIKHSLGLDQVKIALIGGASVSNEIKKFFMSIDIPLSEVFGMSESTGGHCMASRDDPNVQTVGKPLVDIATKVYNPDVNGVGEICLKSRSVFMGYLNDPDKTKDTIDEDGWLHTGDLGTIDDKGYVYITGRSKELIITAGGENVPPVHVENLVKKELPVLSNALLVGEKRKYLVILLTFQVETNPDTGMPSDKLLPVVREWLAGLNVSYTTVQEILDAGPCPIVLEAIEDGIARANKNAISNAQKIQKFAILPQDFSVPTGELGPTFKLKRSFVLRKYSHVIEQLYK